MTPKQYLGQYQRAYRAIRLAGRQLEQAEHDAAGLRAILYSDMPKSKNVERDLSDAMIRIEELAALYRDAVKAGTAIMSEVAAVILKVQDKEQMEILWLRYIDDVDFKHIPGMTNYSDRQMFRLYGRGLEAIRRIMPKDGSECQ